MNKTFVIAGFACLSMVAVAQTKTEPAAAPAKRGISSPTGASADRTAPRDLASGQASGKIAVSHEIKSPRDSASGQATGRVAAGDVTGDGAATVKPVNVTVQYMRGAADHDTIAAATVTRLGNRIANVEAHAWQLDRGKPIAAAQLNVLLRRKSD